ncbi:MAG TPA: hypothetical protein VF432_10665 [Thermoanaerobaculia bacterium]
MSTRYIDEGSTGKARRLLPLATVAAIALLATVVTIYLGTAPTDKKDDRVATVLEESLKASLAFALIALGGTLIKRVVDADLEERRVAREATEQIMERQHANRRAAEDRRREVLNELAAVFSGFYSLRKLYHSAISTRHSVYSNDDAALLDLRRKLLAQTTDLEGRYGAVKVQALISLDFHVGDLQYKTLHQLQEDIADTATDDRLRQRLWFDLLGEAFDGWRHALERDVEIETIGLAWQGYEQALKALMKPTHVANT